MYIHTNTKTRRVYLCNGKKMNEEKKNIERDNQHLQK